MTLMSFKQFIYENSAHPIETAIGTDQFDKHYNDIMNDKTFTDQHAHDLGSRILQAKVTGGKKKTMERIRKIHDSLVTFKLKQQAMNGRSAA